MRILLLGVGLQGRTALSDLVRSPDVTSVLAADQDINRLADFADTLETDKVECLQVDVRDPNELAALLDRDVDLVIELLPSAFQTTVLKLAVRHGKHAVSTTYDDGLSALHEAAEKNDVAIMPESGLDPGLDLVLCRLAIDRLDEVHELYSYGAGIPERAAATNPLHYKISWNFDDVLKAYNRPARVLRDGQTVDVPAEQLLAPPSLHAVAIDGVGELEAFPNADALAYADRFGIRRSVRSTGRYSMRWPGHGQLLGQLIDLGFLSDAPVETEGGRIAPRAFLRDHLGPQMQYNADERDLAILRVDARGIKDGVETRIVYDLVDRRDLSTGFLAMNRTVGFTASIVAQMILRGDIARRGVLSPTSDIPGDALLDELRKRGVIITQKAGPNPTH